MNQCRRGSLDAYRCGQCPKIGLPEALATSDEDTQKRHNATKLNTAQRRCLNPVIAIPRHPCVCIDRATVQTFRTGAGYVGIGRWNLVTAADADGSTCCVGHVRGDEANAHRRPQYFGVILRLVGGLGIWPSLILGSARQSAPLAASSAPRFSISGSIVSACL